MTGVFVVLEGLDGSGTTTQAELLAQWFAGEGARFGKCVSTCEPTPGPAGSIARMVLNHRFALDSKTMALLFAADRTDHVHKTGDNLQEPGISHLLRQGVHVVCDRYLLSSLAYQSLDLPMAWVAQINGQVIAPDITIYIDVAPHISMGRLQEGRFHRDLYEVAETQSRVQVLYEQAIDFLQKEGQHICRVDGNQPEETVRRAILREVLPLLERAR